MLMARHGLQVYDVVRHTPLAALNGHGTGAVLSLAVGTTGQLISGGVDGAVCVWNANSLIPAFASLGGGGGGMC